MAQLLIEISKLQLDSLSDEWVEAIYDAEFLQFSEIPTEYILKSSEIHSLFQVIIDAIDEWLSNDADLEERSWSYLSQPAIQHRKLLALLAYYIDVGRKDVYTKELRNNALLASRLYYKLLAVPGFKAYDVYHSQLFAHSLVCLNFPKILCDNEDKYSNMRELTYEVNALIKSLKNFVEDLSKVIESLPFSPTDMNFEDILTNLVGITSGAIVIKLNIDKVELTKVTKVIYDMIDIVVCDADHKPRSAALQLLYKCFLPKLVAASVDSRSANNLVRASYVTYAGYLLNKYGKEALIGYNVLLQHLCYTLDGLERAEVRNSRVSLVLGLMSLLPRMSHRNFVKWLLKLSTTSKVSHRQIALELLAKLLSNKPELIDIQPILPQEPVASTSEASRDTPISIDSMYIEDENSHELPGPTENELEVDDYEGGPLRARTHTVPHATVLRAVYERVNDVSSALRARALAVLADCVNSPHRPVRDAVEELNGDGEVSRLMAVSARCVGDERAVVRRAAVTLLHRLLSTANAARELERDSGETTPATNNTRPSSVSTVVIAAVSNNNKNISDDSGISNTCKTNSTFAEVETNESVENQENGNNVSDDAPTQNPDDSNIDGAPTSDPEVITIYNEAPTDDPEVVTISNEAPTDDPEVVTISNEAPTDDPEVVTISNEAPTDDPEVVTISNEAPTDDPEVVEINDTAPSDKPESDNLTSVAPNNALQADPIRNDDDIYEVTENRFLPSSEYTVLVGVCRDASIVVRVEAITALGELAAQRPRRATLDAFLAGALHQLSDPELKVQELVVRQVQDLLINRLRKYEPGAIENKLPWMFLEGIIQHNMRRHLQKACTLLHKSSNCINHRLVDVVSTHLGVASQRRDLQCLVLLTSVARHVGYADLDFLLTFYYRIDSYMENEDRTGLEAGESRDPRVLALTLELCTVWSRFASVAQRTALRERLVRRLADDDDYGCRTACASLAAHLEPTNLQWATELMRLSERRAVAGGGVEEWLRAADLSLVAPEPPSPALLRLFLSGLTDPPAEWSAAQRGACVAGAGRLCVRSRGTAAAAAPALAAVLRDGAAPLPARLNALRALADICTRYTCIVEPLLEDVCECVGKTAPAELRRGAVRAVTRLLLGGYLRLRTPLYYKYCALLADDDPDVREPAEYYVTSCLTVDTIYHHLVDCVVYYNSVEFVRSAKLDFDARQLVYDVMLQRLSPVQRLNAQCRFARDVLTRAADEADETHAGETRARELPEDTRHAVLDTITLLCGPRMRLPRKPPNTGGDADDLQERITTNIVSHKMKRTVAEVVVPAVLRLYAHLRAGGGQLATYLVRLATDLLADYRAEIEELIENDEDLVERVRQFQETIGLEPSFGNTRNLVTTSAPPEPETPRASRKRPPRATYGSSPRKRALRI